mmetsp:Transcript_101781/g.292049  ORF Transcript_101781/g.292049 Transcript_101781/m.292049 type:complete len:320 (-) Transcript_101781:84-1043(-)
MQLVRAQVIVELVVAALDLLGGIQLQGIPSQFARATVHAVVFASNVHELRPSSLALNGKEQGRAVPGLPNTAGVVELHEGGANGADDWPPVINEGELHAELPARTEVLRGVQRLQHPVALGRLLQLEGGAGMPEPLVHVLRRAILDKTILVQEARTIHSKLRVFIQNRVILHAKDRVIRKLLHETFTHRGHQHDMRYGHLLAVLAFSHALFLQQHAIQAEAALLFQLLHVQLRHAADVEVVRHDADSLLDFPSILGFDHRVARPLDSLCCRRDLLRAEVDQSPPRHGPRRAAAVPPTTMHQRRGSGGSADGRSGGDGGG